MKPAGVAHCCAPSTIDRGDRLKGLPESAALGFSLSRPNYYDHRLHKDYRIEPKTCCNDPLHGKSTTLVDTHSTKPIEGFECGGYRMIPDCPPSSFEHGKISGSRVEVADPSSSRAQGSRNILKRTDFVSEQDSIRVQSSLATSGACAEPSSWINPYRNPLLGFLLRFSVDCMTRATRWLRKKISCT
jgi:hypothetical protein